MVVIISTKAGGEMVVIAAEVKGTWKKGGRRSWFWTMGEIPHFGKGQDRHVWGSENQSQTLLLAS